MIEDNKPDAIELMQEKVARHRRYGKSLLQEPNTRRALRRLLIKRCMEELFQAAVFRQMLAL